jgi:hypothetical protein
MSNTLTVRLPEELLDRLRRASRQAGLPMGRMVRQSLETTLNDLSQEQKEKNPLLQFSGVIEGGPRNLSSRKGFSRE